MSQPKISEVLAKPDVALEMTLRPSLFSDFTGQAKVKERLEIAVAAAKQRGEALDHILLSGPPGLGKTTLADRKSTRLNSSHGYISYAVFCLKKKKKKKVTRTRSTPL